MISLSRSVMWLRLSAYMLLAFVAIWFLAVFPPIDRPASLLIDFLDWPVDRGSEFLSDDVRWLSAIGSGLLAFMAMNHLLVVAPELEAGNFRVLKGSAIALLSWYLIDSVGSYAVGVPSNIFFNTVFLGLLLGPLWLVGRSQSEPTIG